MRILVTGAGGQLGRELLSVDSPKSEEWIGLTRQEIDVTNEVQVNHMIERLRPNAIIHTAAYTAVDQAEKEQDAAFRVNAVGTRNLAVAAEKLGAKLCYISTDYVFDGKKPGTYKEYDEPKPLNVYGQSKKAGEQLVQTLCSRYFIVRTSWLYGNYGNNFVTSMLNLASQRKELQVVNDQMGSPTYAKDLAYFLMELVRTERYGIYHATNTGECTWYEFAKEIFRLSGLSVKVVPCTTEEFPRPARRPQRSVLEPLSIRINGFESFRHWREALEEHLTENNGEQS